MPRKLEMELKKAAKAKRLTGDRKNAYIYGTIAKIEREKKIKDKRSSKRSRKARHGGS